MLINSSKNRGFSLVEILIGIVILAIALLAIAGMQLTSIKGNAFSSTLMQAAFHGQDGLETLRSIPIPGGVWPAPLAIGQHNFGHTPNDGNSAISGTIYSRIYAVTQHPTIANIRVITVTVNWTDKKNHTVSFSTTRTSIQ